MRIGIVGAGHIGGTLARLWRRAGHFIVLGVRDTDKVVPLLTELRGGASAGSPLEAARMGEILVFAGPYGAWPDYAQEAVEALAGKVVIDAANPYPERDGKMAEAALAQGSGEATAALVPRARLVKAFNTLFWRDLAEKGGQGFGLALAGDDPDAVELTVGLVRDAGFDPVVAGPLRNARRFDPDQPAYAKLLTPEALRDALASANTGDPS